MSKQDQQERYHELARKWLDGSITPEESAEYSRWFNEDDGDPVLVPADFAVSSEELKQRIFKKVEARTGGRVVIYRKLWRVAAAVVLIAGLVYGVVRISSSTGADPKELASSTPSEDNITGVMQKATLTLDDGKKIVLDSAGNGMLTQQGSTNVMNVDGSIVYNNTSGENTIRYNTLTTHRGEQYALVLSDGTKILADASTTIRFPVSFPADVRNIEINGHAWLQVAHDERRPFQVIKGDKKVQVLGTSFDVNAYDDEADLKVTLIQGSVKVMNGASSQLIKPGQQAVLEITSNKISLVNNVDMEQVMAWKNGLFSYKSASVENVLKDMKRWYDIDVVYKGKPTDTFTGEIPRTATLPEILKILEMSRIRLRLDGKTLTILSNSSTQ